MIDQDSWNYRKTVYKLTLAEEGISVKIQCFMDQDTPVPNAEINTNLTLIEAKAFRDGLTQLLNKRRLSRLKEGFFHIIGIKRWLTK